MSAYYIHVREVTFFYPPLNTMYIHPVYKVACLYPPIVHVHNYIICHVHVHVHNYIICHVHDVHVVAYIVMHV